MNGNLAWILLLPVSLHKPSTVQGYGERGNRDWMDTEDPH